MAFLGQSLFTHLITISSHFIEFRFSLPYLQKSGNSPVPRACFVQCHFTCCFPHIILIHSNAVLCVYIFRFAFFLSFTAKIQNTYLTSHMNSTCHPPQSSRQHSRCLCECCLPSSICVLQMLHAVVKRGPHNTSYYNES